MHHLIMDNIIIYHTTIIPHILNKVGDYKKLKIVKDWSI